MSATALSQFEPSVYAARLEQAAGKAAADGLTGLILGTGSDFAYFTGSWIATHERLTVLAIPADGRQPVIVTPKTDVGELKRSPAAAAGIRVLGWEDGDDPHTLALNAARGKTGAYWAKIGVGQSLTADHVLRFQQLLGHRSDSTVLATPIVRTMTMIKDAAEIAQLQAAARAIDEVHAQVKSLLVPGRTEREVADDIYSLIISGGHTSVDFVIVGSGPNGADPHHEFSDRKLEQGDVVVVDIGGSIGAGYRSDCTRTYLVEGTTPDDLSEKMRTAYAVLEKAQMAAIEAVRPGVSCSEIDAVARGIISEAGLGRYFVHRTGHGIGLSTHEEPFITAGNDLTLAPGMVFSIEPGIYVPGITGARIEDIVVVTDTGCEVLNQRPRSLQ
ncbi:M24 family metallopeptidase [Corynebacterium mendelii]|uniref:Aminopeptidase P family protein n=1 Tax=Corynebacterium mendelii TaxID=2765362 RepID=A0A939E0B4_9CORY|nr:Xaa-Pro peptidase family protein [Corynebacterium mendelii]MBN9643518.1 aminopeptidase P family protein [Corynebacterium mendelii]